MNRQQWILFHSHLRTYARLGGGINMFPCDFNQALRLAIPDEVQRYALWADGRLQRLWTLALSIYPCF